MKRLLSLLALLTFAPNAFAVDLVQIEKDLNSSGIKGTIHGAVQSQGLFVFSFRNPTDFFDHVEMSLVSEDAELTKKMSALNRHDIVMIKGKFLKNPSPQVHILLSSLEMVKKFDSGFPVEPYRHEAKIPEELLNLQTANFLVHAIAGEGHILVAEYKDSIVPFFVKNAELTKNLWRNDLVQLNFRVKQNPGQPTHLALNESEPNALKVLESIKSLHDKPASIEGALVMFPKSPEIIFNVFAVDQPLKDGLKRQFTIVNFEDPALFKQVRELLQAAWDKPGNTYSNGRNKLISNTVRVRITGTFNEVSASQANPQILVKALTDIAVLSK